MQNEQRVPPTNKCVDRNCTCKKRPGDWTVNDILSDNCFWQHMLDNERPHTLQEVSDLLGIPISAVVSLEKKALKKLLKHTKDLK
jgi:hypothetical protein